MFDTQLIPCYVERMGHKTIKIGKDKYKGTELVLRIDPFTPELAVELEAVKGICFRRNDGEVNPHIDAVSFTVKPKPQTVEIHGAPEIQASVKIHEAKLSKVRVRKPSDGSQWVMVFRVTFAEIGGNDLLYLKDALFEQRFFSFNDAQGGLFTEAEAEARREKAPPVRGQSVSGDEATTH